MVIGNEKQMKRLDLIKYIPFFISCFILFLFSYKIVRVEKIYDKYYILLNYGYLYTAHDITIDTNFGKIYLKQFTQITKIYTSASEFSDPPYYTQCIGTQIGYNWWSKNYNDNSSLLSGLIIATPPEEVEVKQF
jgi:hypothetical protein